MALDCLHAEDELLPSSRTVRIELDGLVLAESARAQLLFEHPILPVRSYLPPEDVMVQLRPSATRTRCPYKGEASYWSVERAGRTIDDLAWSYPQPLPAAAPVAGLICFFDERVDVSLGGRPQPRMPTPWSQAAGRTGDPGEQGPSRPRHAAAEISAGARRAPAARDR